MNKYWWKRWATGGSELHSAAQDLPEGNTTWHSTSEGNKVKIWNKNGKKNHAMNSTVVIRNLFFITNYVREFSKY